MKTIISVTRETIQSTFKKERSKEIVWITQNLFVSKEEQVSPSSQKPITVKQDILHSIFFF